MTTLIDRRSNSVIAKLIELGHDPRDVQSAAENDEDYEPGLFRIPRQLTDAGKLSFFFTQAPIQDQAVMTSRFAPFL